MSPKLLITRLDDTAHVPHGHNQHLEHLSDVLLRKRIVLITNYMAVEMVPSCERGGEKKKKNISHSQRLNTSHTSHLDLHLTIASLPFAFKTDHFEVRLLEHEPYLIARVQFFFCDGRTLTISKWPVPYGPIK